MNLRTATHTRHSRSERADAGQADRGRAWRMPAVSTSRHVPKRSRPLRPQHAASVDRESRFPAEAIAAARAERLLGVAVPRELGGEGASIADVVDICYTLGRACASTAMIYAMHQTKVACITRHGTRQRLASAAAAPAVQRANAARVLDHRGPGRRRRAQQRGAGRAQRCAHHAGAPGDGDLLRRSGRRHRHHRAALAPTPPAPIRCSSSSSSRITRSSGSTAGTRSACAAPAAPASSWSRRAAASRSCR